VAVDSELWWSVWWPWVVVFGVGLLGLAVAVGAFVVAWRARHRFAPNRTVPGFTFYLDEGAVEEIYRVGGFGDLIAKEVTRTVGVTKDGKLAIPGVSLDVGKATSSEIIETYIKEYKAIDVIGLLINALDDGDDLLHVNLSRRTVERNVALERAMAKAGDTSGRLRKLKSYVLVEGDFRDGGEIEDGRIYLAPIGDEQDGPQVRVECEKKLLADKKSRPKGPFMGVCLGRVLSWEDPDLTIRPIAIFL
jgi:hypothetical protein